MLSAIVIVDPLALTANTWFLIFSRLFPVESLRSGVSLYQCSCELVNLFILSAISLYLASDLALTALQEVGSHPPRALKTHCFHSIYVGIVQKTSCSLTSTILPTYNIIQTMARLCCPYGCKPRSPRWGSFGSNQGIPSRMHRLVYIRRRVGIN